MLQLGKRVSKQFLLQQKNSNPAATQKITMTQLKFCFAKKSGFNFDEVRLKFCSKANLPGSNFPVKKKSSLFMPESEDVFTHFRHSMRDLVSLKIRDSSHS